MRRLLTIGHSYCVGLNRRLADELSRDGEWEVTVVGPTRFRGDYRVHHTKQTPHEQCSVTAVPVHLASRPHTLVYGWPLKSLLAQPWDLVHCWEEPYVASAAQIAAWTPPQIPLVFATFQNIDKQYPPPFSWFERYTFGRAAGLIAFGQTVLDVALAHGFARSRIRMIPPGVDTHQFAPDRAARARIRTSLGWGDEAPVVGFVGRFVPEKGLRVLTDALAGLRTPWRALFVGAGSLESELRRWAQPLGDRVAIATTVTHDEVPDWLNAMDVLCAPSQTTTRWREQFGRMLIEAFAVGLPVIASDSGEIPHVVAQAGVVVAESDAGAWTRALAALLDDPGRLKELAEDGRARALTHYDWSVVADQHAGFFRELIEGAADVAGVRMPAVEGARA